MAALGIPLGLKGTHSLLCSLEERFSHFSIGGSRHSLQGGRLAAHHNSGRRCCVGVTRGQQHAGSTPSVDDPERECVSSHETQPSRTATTGTRVTRGTRVKICGLTSAEDAAVAAAAGAQFAGMILWPKAKRYVEPEVAKLIGEAAREGGAEAVGVFVDESAEEIERVCIQVGITIAQLHGDVARAALGSLPDWLSTIYVAHVDPEGTIVTQLPSSEDGERVPEWLLLDGLQGGSGVAIDWESVQVPLNCYRRGWILAGGLSPANVGAAISSLHPDVVDVSSGVCGPDKLAKDHALVRAFVQEANLAPTTT